MEAGVMTRVSNISIRGKNKKNFFKKEEKDTPNLSDQALKFKESPKLLPAECTSKPHKSVPLP